MTISENVQSFDPGKRIELFDLDASMFGQGILRFTAAGFDENQGGLVSFGENDYNPLPIASDGFEWNGRGVQPRPTLTLSNISAALRSLLFETDGLVGAEITRRITFDRFLVGHEEPDGDQVISNDIFYIERMESMNKMFVKLQLSTILDIENVQFPGGQVIRNTCINTYRVWDGTKFIYSEGRACPYVEDLYYDVNDNLTNAAQDHCSKRIQGCQKRFGENGPLPIIAFPGLIRI